MKAHAITIATVERYISIVISLCVFGAIALYISLIALTMAYATSTKEFTQLQQHVRSEIATIEAEYFKRTSTLAITDASTFGLVSVSLSGVVDSYANLTYAPVQ